MWPTRTWGICTLLLLSRDWHPGQPCFGEMMMLGSLSFAVCSFLLCEMLWGLPLPASQNTHLSF